MNALLSPFVTLSEAKGLCYLGYGGQRQRFFAALRMTAFRDHACS